ncbi:glycosyltransferase family 4 protein [Frondihabitans sp. PAMC 28766]|uniref:glycosyltransferase family 4 protein n=1 Tax=Frondihabitans sp. PAMC 28766 TaxID=1795630 RepID=UPI0012FF85DE|nr:glycosyltransferase family 4 protein [Frondihabitans sp. PAMC 28766]
MVLDSRHATAGGHGSRRRDPRARLRILTSTEFLEPVGGIELCLDEDTRALVADGHAVEILYARDGSMRRGFEAEGVRMTGPFSFLFRPNHALRDLARFVRAARAARRSHADVLWLNRPEYLVWGQVVARIARLPLVVHLHHAPNYNNLGLLSRRVARFVAVSDYMKQEWVDRGIPEDRVAVVPNAVPPDKYPFADLSDEAEAKIALGVDPGTRVALYLGRLVESKGVATLLDAWRGLGLAPSKAVLVLAGSDADGPIAQLLSAMPEGSVRVLPVQSDVLPLLTAADVVVSPSIAPEGFGRVLVEAMSTGRPAIGTRQGGMVDVLTGEMAPMLVIPGDAEGLATRLSQLLDWHESDPLLGLRCRAFVETHFSYERHVDDLENVLMAASAARKAPVNR